MATYSATYTDIFNAVCDKVRLDTTDDTSRVSGWINGEIAKIAIETGYFKGSSDGAALAAAASNQSLPTTLVRLDYITCTYGGQSTQLAEAVSLDSILALRSQGASSGTPKIYYLWQGVAEFWPSAFGGEILSYYGSILPDTISGTTVCPLPEPFSKLVEYAACFEACQFKKDPMIEEFRSLYEEWMRRFRAYLNQRRGRKGLQFDLKVMEDFNWRPHDPSTDILTWP